MKIAKEKMKSLSIYAGIFMFSFALGIILTMIFSDFFNDRYRLVLYEVSSDNKKAGVVVSNVGGGGGSFGWCRDLVYDFPNINDWGIPDLHFEKDNEKYLIEEKGCGEAKSIEWVEDKLKIN